MNHLLEISGTELLSPEPTESKPRNHRQTKRMKSVWGLFHGIVKR